MQITVIRTKYILKKKKNLNYLRERNDRWDANNPCDVTVGDDLSGTNRRGTGIGTPRRAVSISIVIGITGQTACYSVPYALRSFPTKIIAKLQPVCTEYVSVLSLWTLGAFGRWKIQNTVKSRLSVSVTSSVNSRYTCYRHDVALLFRRPCEPFPKTTAVKRIPFHFPQVTLNHKFRSNRGLFFKRIRGQRSI